MNDRYGTIELPTFDGRLWGWQVVWTSVSRPEEESGFLVEAHSVVFLGPESNADAHEFMDKVGDREDTLYVYASEFEANMEAIR